MTIRRQASDNFATIVAAIEAVLPEDRPDRRVRWALAYFEEGVGLFADWNCCTHCAMNAFAGGHEIAEEVDAIEDVEGMTMQ